MTRFLALTILTAVCACGGSSSDRPLSRLQTDLLPSDGKEQAGLALYAYVVFPNSTTNLHKEEVLAVTESYRYLFSLSNSDSFRSSELDTLGILYYPVKRKMNVLIENAGSGDSVKTIHYIRFRDELAKSPYHKRDRENLWRNYNEDFAGRITRDLRLETEGVYLIATPFRPLGATLQDTNRGLVKMTPEFAREKSEADLRQIFESERTVFIIDLRGKTRKQIRNLMEELKNAAITNRAPNTNEPSEVSEWIRDYFKAVGIVVSVLFAPGNAQGDEPVEDNFQMCEFG